MPTMKLARSTRFAGCPGPVVTVILDGVGIAPRDDGDAVKTARTPTLDALMAEHPTTRLRAHGTAVGMPSDEDMGNSEVGHNALGAGRVFDQGAKLVDRGDRQRRAVQRRGLAGARRQLPANGSATLHFLGLFSDGNVHCHIDHLKAMLAQAKSEGVQRARVHILLDGRDVPRDHRRSTTSSRFEAFLAGLDAAPAFDFRIASGGGRMLITMDRYEADWRMVERGLGRPTSTARAGSSPPRATAIETFRAESPGVDRPGPARRSSSPSDGQPRRPDRRRRRAWSSSTSAATAPSRSSRAFEEDALRRVRPRPAAATSATPA